MSIKNKIRSVNETLLELVLGIVPVTVVAAIVGVVLIVGVDAFKEQSVWRYLWSLLLGAVCAAFVAFHMYMTLNRGLDMLTDDAAKYSRRGYVLRLVFMVLVLLCGLKLPFFNFAGVFVGMLTLKVSIYIRPLTKRMLAKLLATKD